MCTIQTTFNVPDDTAYNIASVCMKGTNRSSSGITITNPETGKVLFQYKNGIIQWADADFVTRALSEN